MYHTRLISSCTVWRRDLNEDGIPLSQRGSIDPTKNILTVIPCVLHTCTHPSKQSTYISGKGARQGKENRRCSQHDRQGKEKTFQRCHASAEGSREKELHHHRCRRITPIYSVKRKRYSPVDDDMRIHQQALRHYIRDSAGSARFAHLTIFFWRLVTCSGGSSTPRSPLATIIPSDSSRISSKLSTASASTRGHIRLHALGLGQRKLDVHSRESEGGRETKTDRDREDEGRRTSRAGRVAPCFEVSIGSPPECPIHAARRTRPIDAKHNSSYDASPATMVSYRHDSTHMLSPKLIRAMSPLLTGLTCERYCRLSSPYFWYLSRDSRDCHL